MKKILLISLIFLNCLNAETQSTDPQRFKKNFEQNKINNPQSGFKGENPIRIVGTIMKIREYNDYNVFEILTDRNEKIDIRYRKNSLLRKDSNITMYCKNWNVIEYMNCN